jgi:RNA polymerase sigma factor (sigma-70 family)
MSPPPPSIDLALLLAERPWVERLARSLVDDPALADDLAQEAWLVAARRGPADAQSLRPFLRGVLVNLRRAFARSEGRRAAREVAASAPEALPSAAELVVRAELHRLLVESVLALGETERTAILLCYFEGLSAEEVARRAGVPAATIRSRVHRGLAHVRERLEARGNRRELFAGLALLARRPAPCPDPGVAPCPDPGVAPSSGSVAAPAGTALTTLGGILAMKTTFLALATGLAAASLAVGWWLLERPPSSPRAGETTLTATPGEHERLPPPAEGEGEVPAPEHPGTPGERTSLAGAIEPVAPAATAAEPAPPRVDARVVDETGRPIAGVVASESDEERARSDASGAIEMSLAPVQGETTTRLVFTHPRHARRIVDARVAPDALVHLGTLELVPAGTLEGTVEDEAGRPVADAAVRVTGLESGAGDPEVLRRHEPTPDDATLEARTDASGRFRVEAVAVGTARAWAGGGEHAWSSSGALDVRADATLRDVRIVVGALRSDDRIAGRVLDPEGAPVAGAEVAYWYTAASLGSGGGVETDAEGRFDWRLDQRVAHDLTVSDPENRWADVYALHVEPGTRDLVVQFGAPEWIEAEVVDEDGEPLEAFTLQPEDRSSGNWLRMAAALEDAREGFARVRVPSYTFFLTASLRGYQSATLGPFDPEDPPESLRFELESLPGVHGRVLGVDRAPLAGARVDLRSLVRPGVVQTRDGFRTLILGWDKDMTTTDAEGRFTLYPPEEGEYVVEAEAKGYALGSIGPQAFDPTRAAEVELELVRGGAIEGRVLAPAGVDPTGFVLAYHRGDGRAKTLRLGPERRYRIEGLTPGPWELVPLVHELAGNRSGSTSMVLPEGAEVPAWEWTCEVRDGETTVHDVDLSEFAPCMLEGELAVEGRSLTGWTAALERPGFPDVESVASVGLGADGRFALVAPRAGSYEFVLRGPSDPGGRLEISDTVELEPDGPLAWSCSFAPGRVEGSGAVGRGTRERFFSYDATVPTGSGTASARVRIVPDDSGSFVLPTVPPGPGKISRNDPPADGQEFAPWEVVAEFEVEPGETERLVLQ